MQKLDNKHHIEGDKVIKTSNNTIINLAVEPVILFRARDYLALPMLMHYRQMCIEDGCTDYQLTSLNDMIKKFTDFTVTHVERMKQPGITKGL